MNTTYESDKHFKHSLRTILDLIQLLKYNLDDFKSLKIHKDIPGNKNMKSDCAALLLALNGFLFKLQQKAPESFGRLLHIMQRDKLHDLSLHLEVVYLIDNLPDITESLKLEIDLLKQQKS